MAWNFVAVRTAELLRGRRFGGDTLAAGLACGIGVRGAETVRGQCCPEPTGGPLYFLSRKYKTGLNRNISKKGGFSAYMSFCTQRYKEANDGFLHTVPKSVRKRRITKNLEL